MIRTARLQDEAIRLHKEGVSADSDRGQAFAKAYWDMITEFTGGGIAFIGTVEELNERVGKHYHILIKTDVGTEHVETNQIGEALLSLLSHYKEAGTEILDIQVDRGSLEQHVMKIARGN